jgi:tetratricopeptide (TPR) repeat protein
MSFLSRTIKLLLTIINLGLVAAPTTLAQQPDQVNKRDLDIQRLGTEVGTARTPAIPHGYALVFGVGKYEKLDPKDNLRFSETDADAVFRVLISQQGGAFPPENVHKHIGPQATLANMRQEIEHWLPEVCGTSDRVIVYFAGHGFVAGGRGYIAPWDVDPSKPEDTAYPMDALGKVLAERVRAKWKVLLVDACHSGKITPESDNGAVDEQVSQLPTGFLTLTATRERESSFEDPNLSSGFGVFSYFLVQGLQGAADNSPCDGVITADELINYVRSGVSNYVRARGEYETPTEHGDFDNNMVLGANPRCVNSAPASAPLQGSVVIEVNMDEVSVYLDEGLIGTAAKGKPLSLPGLAAGMHTVKGVRKGYEPDTKQIMVIPGQVQSISLRIQYRRTYKPAAMDLVDRGEKLLFSQTSAFDPLSVYTPSRQTQADLKKARALFEEALRVDPSFPQAAYDLGLACQLLSDSKPMLEAFRRAVELDPTFVEAAVQYAGALIEQGDPDQAIRQLTEVLRLEPNNDLAYSHLGRAYLDKGIWDRTIEAVDKAIALSPTNHQAYLWKADALRRQAAEQKKSALRPAIYAQAVENYRTFLRMSNFSSPSYEKLAYYFVGFGLGKRGHADREIPYAYQRSLAYMGLCECETKLGQFMRASDYCHRAIKYDPEEPLTYFLLGNVYRDLFNQDNSRDYLLSARANYVKMLRINPDLELSSNAKNYIEQIDRLLPMVK